MKTKLLHVSGATLRRVVATVLSAMLLFSLPACTHNATQEDPGASGGSAASTLTEDNQGAGLVIVASIFAPYDFARTIAGDAAQVTMLVPPGAETHSFEPSPADLKLLNTADVFIYVGGESDAWLEKTISSLDNPDLTLIRLTDIVATLAEEQLEGMDTRQGAHEHENDAHDEDEGHVHENETHEGAEEHDHEGGQDTSVADHEHEGEADEHVWTSVRNAERIVASFAQTFAKLDREHADLFKHNADELREELQALDATFSSIVKNASHTTLVFGDRFPFRYFAEDYGLTCYAAFPGCSTAVDTNPSTIIFLIEKVREEQLPAVLYLELSDQRIARTIAEETGAEPLLFHSVHNISKEDFDSGATYISLMQQNAKTLEAALS